MRIQKIKSKQALSEREKHNTRAKTVLSADGSNNISVEGHTSLSKRLDVLEKQVNINNTRKTRKDAIRAIEVLFTSDKKFFESVDHEQYFKLCKEWLEETFQTEELCQYSIHLDEECPHLHCIISTLKDGKFNYSGYVNGRQDLRALQDSFYAKVEHLGVERGVKQELTKATYQSNKDYNKNIAKARDFVEALSKENKTDYAVKGYLAQEEEKKILEQVANLRTENMELRIENMELEDKYRGLRKGITMGLKGNAKQVEQIEKQGIHFYKLEKQKQEEKLMQQQELEL